MGNLIIIAIVALLVGVAVRSLVRAKKQGVKCIGCSSSGACHCGCGKEKEK